MTDPYRYIKKQFEENSDAENAVKMAAYMKNHFSFYGIPAPKRKALCKELLKEARKQPAADWAFLDRCWAEDCREFQYLVVDLLTAMQRSLVYEDVARIYPYVKTKQWWDTIDGFDRVIGNIALIDSRIDDLMLDWATDEDFWLRRIAIDHQLGRKEKTNAPLLEKILTCNLGSTEFFINKAIGWSLRDYSKCNPAWVRAFLEKYRDKMAPLSIREASKYL